MNEATLLQEAARILAARLPAGWKQRVTRLEARPQGRPDAILDVTGPDGTKVRLSVEAKTRLVPRAPHSRRRSEIPSLVTVPDQCRIVGDDAASARTSLPGVAMIRRLPMTLTTVSVRR